MTYRETLIFGRSRNDVIMMLSEYVRCRQISPAQSNSSSSTDGSKQPNTQCSAVRRASTAQHRASGSQPESNPSDRRREDVAASPQQKSVSHNAKASELDRQLQVSSDMRHVAVLIYSCCSHSQSFLSCLQDILARLQQYLRCCRASANGGCRKNVRKLGVPKGSWSN